MHLWHIASTHIVPIITLLSLSSSLFPLKSETNKDLAITASIKYCTGLDKYNEIFKKELKGIIGKEKTIVFMKITVYTEHSKNLISMNKSIEKGFCTQAE